MFIGPINVRASRKDVQLKVKEEYNSYRVCSILFFFSILFNLYIFAYYCYRYRSMEQDRTALLFLLFPSTLLMLRSWIWDGCLPAFPVQLYQVVVNFIFLISLFFMHVLFPYIRHMHMIVYRHGCCSSILVWLCERTYWDSMEVIFALGISWHSFVFFVFLFFGHYILDKAFILILAQLPGTSCLSCMVIIGL